MPKKRMRGFTADGYVKVQRTVLRRVVNDRLQCLINGDFIQRHNLSEDDYDPLVSEIKGLKIISTPTQPDSTSGIDNKDGGVNNSSSAKGGGGENGLSKATAATTNGAAKNDGAPQDPSPQHPPPINDETINTFSSNLETFIQLIAASIMIDASMRGENAGESDTRFIKKKKKILVKTIQGPKLDEFQKEVIRYDKIKCGEDFIDEEIVESEDSKSTSNSEDETSEEEQRYVKKKKASKYANMGLNITTQPLKAPAAAAAGADSSSDDDDDDASITSKSEADDTASSLDNENSTLDGFSTSQASSSKGGLQSDTKQRKKDKKRLKREKKERKRKEKEERRKKRKAEKERKKKEKDERKKKRKSEKEAAKRKKKKRKLAGGGDKVAAEDSDDDDASFVGHNRNNEDDEHMEGDSAHHQNDESDIDSAIEGDVEDEMDVDDDDDGNNVEEDDDGPQIYEIATKSDFDKYKADLLSRLPKRVKVRFRQGGFSRWGKDWLPVLELGPFDVEPGPVRDMWLDMFDNTQESGRSMTRLVFWYGVKYEDRAQAYSFVPEAKIIPYEEGESKGYCIMPKKILTKIEKKQKLTKTEEQIKRGLVEIVADMKQDKSERLAWMMKFKEDYELAEEEAVREEAQKKMKAEVLGKKKKKLGRPKKDDGTVKRKPGRPKKVVDDDDDAPKKKLGRPKKDKLGKKKHSSSAKKWEMMDDEQESDIETDSEEDDRDYDEGGSDSDEDLDVDSDAESAGKKRKATSEPKKKKRRNKNLTEEERATERKAKAAEYREKKAREKAEAQGLEYVKGRVGRKSKATMLEEEQLKFTKCEEVFLPVMEKLTKAKDDSNVKRVLKCINAINERVDLLTPPFLREYPLGMLVKQVRKAFEGEHPEVKERCKSLTVEMKRVYSDKDGKVPEEFEAVKNWKKEEHQQESAAASSPVPEVVKAKKVKVKSKKVVANVETPAAVKPAAVKTPAAENVDAPIEPSLSKHNSEMSLPDAVKSEPKQKKSFSLKGMFEKPKPTLKQKISAPVSSSVANTPQPSPKPTKTLPSWVTGPAMKMEDFHEQHAKERNFGLEFLVDAASVVTYAKKFDPVSVSQSFELAIFAETKLRGRDWDQYWEKIHDIVAMLSPGREKRNAILQGIINGDYAEPSELVKLSRREIETVNKL